jgi:hypothetical protein
MNPPRGGFFVAWHPGEGRFCRRVNGRECGALEHFPIKWIPVDRRKCIKKQMVGAGDLIQSGRVPL